MGLLDGKIAKQVGGGLKKAGLSLPATLIKVTPGARTSNNQAGGTNPTEASFAARGFVTKTTKDKIGGTLVEKTDRIIALLGSTIASGQVPATNDKITIEGVTTRVFGVDRDPAKAVYICLTRQ